MSTFVRLPSGRIVNTAQIVMLSEERQITAFYLPAPLRGREVYLTAACPGESEDRGAWWLDKADADALVAALGIEFHEPAPAIAAQPDELAGG